MLTDIQIVHEYTGSKGPRRSYVMSPFRNQRGDFAGQFEILYTKRLASGKRVKRSGHVSKDELAELFARELLREHDIRLRLRPVEGDYPDSAPGKKIPSSCIQPGSEFDRLVRAIDARHPISASLRAELGGMGVAV